jgi:formylglycine-generating enzyme
VSPNDATTDGSPTPDAGSTELDSSVGDAFADAGPCPGMVVVPSATADGGFYCIDATEVTQGAYQTFLAAKQGDTSGQALECLTNASYAPVGCPANPFQPTTRSAYPVSCIDWCDAHAYCRWAGKRLCGGIAGGSVPSGKFATVESQWYAACSHHDDGLHTRAYGNAYEPLRCNGSGFDSGLPDGGPIPVGSATGCVGGYPGIFDMMGNVYEWEDSFDPEGNPIVRGGPWTGGADYHYCSWSALAFSKDFGAADIGFRCCSL